jgi:hypothetical protein
MRLQYVKFRKLMDRNGEDLSIWSPDDCERPAFRDSQPSDVPAAKPSSASLVSTSTTLVGNTEARPSFSPSGIQSGSEVSAALLLDGARAIGAIARPFPIATVGVPQRVDFDIASASFKMSVTVSPEDQADGGKQTEIYLPFIHFANSLDLDEESAPATKSGSSKDQSTSSETPLQLDIDVKVSQGTFTTSGQTLIWKYDTPASGNATYTIEVKRKGGAIKRDVGVTPQGSWFDVCGGCTIG